MPITLVVLFALNLAQAFAFLSHSARFIEIDPIVKFLSTRRLFKLFVRLDWKIGLQVIYLMAAPLLYRYGDRKILAPLAIPFVPSSPSSLRTLITTRAL
jgi:hypothetical protein